MDLDSTMFFRAENNNENSTQDILNTVYEALVEKGYDPINQIVGYILSGDPAYITSHKNARTPRLSIEAAGLSPDGTILWNKTE